ncbi:hypothetical protein GF378_03115 [Candidatus Pacearchaeota archaeon]|nr:hypothetical protein [Candidatus Pacearchaeota archaeon]
MAETILQHWIFTRFALPFLLIFFIVFALLEKTKLLGDGKKQVNALVAFVIGLLAISVAYPIEAINNLILFLTVAIVVAFVGLILWGFVSGGEAKVENKAIKWIIGVVIAIALIWAALWATKLALPFYDFLFGQAWSKTFWTNVAFIAVVAIALAVVLITGAKGKGD